MANIKNNIFCIKTSGITDRLYPKIYSTPFIGLTPNLAVSDEVLSLATKVLVNIVIKDKLNIIIPGVKFSILYISFGILNCPKINNKNSQRK